jgi:hypothetical protein
LYEQRQVTQEHHTGTSKIAAMELDIKEIKTELSRLKGIETKYNTIEAMLQQILASQQAVAAQVAALQSTNTADIQAQQQQGSPALTC